MLDVLNVSRGTGRADAPLHARSSGHLAPYFLELLETAPESQIDEVVEDLRTYEHTGRPSRTILWLLDRARCLAEADRIAMKFEA